MLLNFLAQLVARFKKFWTSLKHALHSSCSNSKTPGIRVSFQQFVSIKRPDWTYLYIIDKKECLFVKPNSNCRSLISSLEYDKYRDPLSSSMSFLSASNTSQITFVEFDLFSKLNAFMTLVKSLILWIKKVVVFCYIDDSLCCPNHNDLNNFFPARSYEAYFFSTASC